MPPKKTTVVEHQPTPVVDATRRQELVDMMFKAFNNFCDGDDLAETVRRLLEQGADPNGKPTPVASANTSGDEKFTPLHIAAKHGQYYTVKCLVEAGADTSARSFTSGSTPLSVAASHGHVEVMVLLITSVSSVNPPDEVIQPPLHSAVQSGRLAAAQLLILLGADVNCTRSGDPLLYVAAGNGDLDMCKLLIKNNVKDRTEMSALYATIRRGQREVTQFLLEGGHYAVGDDQAFIAAVQWQGSIDLIHGLLRRGFDIEKSIHTTDDGGLYSDNGNNVLHFACHVLDNHDVVVELIALGVPIDARNKNNASPLLTAVMFACQSSVLPLLEHGAEVCVSGEDDDETPLHLMLPDDRERWLGSPAACSMPVPL